MFLGTLCLPLLNSQFKWVEFDREDENRVFRDSLEIRLDQLDQFPEECESYFNDNFSFRAPLLKAFHGLKYSVYGVSPHPEKVTIGKDGWYFLAGKEQDIVTGKKDFSEDQLEIIQEEWERRDAYLAQKKIKYYWVICPLKQEIYPEHLPFHVVPKEGLSRVEQIQQQFEDSHLPQFIVDPTKALLKGKKDQKMYFKLDNHWTQSAGEIVSKEIIARIQEDFPEHRLSPASSFKWKEQEIWEGVNRLHLGVKHLHETRRFAIFDSVSSSRMQAYGFKPNFQHNFNWEYEERYLSHVNKDGLKVLFIRDSFGDALRPFFKEAFSETVMIFDAWNYQLHEEIIEEMQPDVVVFLTLNSTLDVFAGEEANWFENQE